MTPAAIPSPYPGPRPFEAGEATRFFGRMREVRDVTALALSYPVLLLYAPSGTGKTSLLQAGVVPRLIGDKHADVLPVGRVAGPATAGDAPGNVFVGNLIANWGRETGERRNAALPPAERRRRVRAGAPTTAPDEPRASATIADYLGRRERGRTPDGLPALRIAIIDQVEELLTLSPERWPDRKDFFLQLAAALKADPLLHVILALREDYLAQLDRYAVLLPDRMRARFRLERLGPEAALEAITRPLEKFDRRFEPGVAERLVDDLREFRVATDLDESVKVKGEFVEPVQLQLACASLWTAVSSDRQTITHDDLDEFGELDRVLSRFYDDAIAQAAHRASLDERELRRWFDSEFITSLDTRSLVLQTRHETAGMPNVVVEELERSHLIRAEERAGARWFELTHDRFIKPVQDSNREAAEGPREGRREALKRARRALGQAERSRAAGRFKAAERAAVKALDGARALEDAEGVTEALVVLAEIEFARGLLEEGFEHAREAHEIAGRSGDRRTQADILRRVAAQERESGRWQEAVRTLGQVMEICRASGDPAGEADAAVAVAEILAERGDRPEAIEETRRALALARDARDVVLEARILDTLGVMRHAQGDDDGALTDLRAALEARKDAGDWIGAMETLANIAAIARSRHDYDDALATATDWLRIAEGIGDAAQQAGAHAEIAGIHEDVGRDGDAVAHLGRAIELEPATPTLWRERAEAHWYAGDLYAALADFTNALVQDPEDLAALSGRGQVRAEMGNGEAALADLDRVLAATDDPALRAYAENGRGLALAHLRRFDDAMAAFDRSLAGEPENAWAYFNRATALDLAADYEGAERDLRASLASDRPALPKIKRDRARARLEGVATASQRGAEGRSDAGGGVLSTLSRLMGKWG